ncbi:MAG: RNA polymerase sigma factor SigZ [Nitrospirales bacterium]|nr:RNA polymerase sigma factor SigZ [Nitrospirales bacterium]
MNRETLSTEHIWELLSAKLRSFLLQRVSDPQMAEDLLQETFLRIHNKLGDIDDKQRITAWVFQIARNLVVDHYRSKGRDPDAAMPDDVEAPTHEEGNLNELVESWLPPMIAQLPDTYREAVELYELKEIPQQQIADKLGISLSGAKSRVQRGREKLKSLLFECCSFEQDRRGNIIGYVRHDPEACDDCNEACNP